MEVQTPSAEVLVAINGDIEIRYNGFLYFYDADNTNYVRIFCPTNITTSYQLTLPPDDGAAGQLLSTDGTGVLSWVNPGSGAQGATGPTGAQGAQGLQGAKPAIVPVQTFMGEEYVELLCVEMPEVYFEDFLTIKAGNQGHQSHTVLGEIDPLFLQVCEEGTIKATAAMPSHPTNVGAKVQGPVVEVSVEGASIQSREVDIIVRLSGIRAGMVGRRFAKRTYQQMVKNNNFWSQW